jgi:hypothetical protein
MRVVERTFSFSMMTLEVCAVHYRRGMASACFLLSPRSQESWAGLHKMFEAKEKKYFGRRKNKRLFKKLEKNPDRAREVE